MNFLYIKYFFIIFTFFLFDRPSFATPSANVMDLKDTAQLILAKLDDDTLLNLLEIVPNHQELGEYLSMRFPTYGKLVYSKDLERLVLQENLWYDGSNHLKAAIRDEKLFWNAIESLWSEPSAETRAVKIAQSAAAMTPGTLLRSFLECVGDQQSDARYSNSVQLRHRFLYQYFLNHLSNATPLARIRIYDLLAIANTEGLGTLVDLKKASYFCEKAKEIDAHFPLQCETRIKYKMIKTKIFNHLKKPSKKPFLSSIHNLKLFYSLLSHPHFSISDRRILLYAYHNEIPSEILKKISDPILSDENATEEDRLLCRIILNHSRFLD